MRDLRTSFADRVLVSHRYTRRRANNFEGHGVAFFERGTIYVGDFFGGMMHGVGTYTWPDGTKFVGEFTRNTITGKGKYIWPDGSSYKGSVLNGLCHGYGVMHGVNNGIPCYKGDWCNGAMHGTGILYYNIDSSCYYKGEWSCNKRSGHGTMQYESGNYYEGGWNQDVKCGAGLMLWRHRLEYYEGEWCDDKQNGNGEHIWIDLAEGHTAQSAQQGCNRYLGQWKDGQRHGIGTFSYANGARYLGDWVQGQKEGMGVVMRDDGALCSGTFHSDRISQSFTKSEPELASCAAESQVYLHLEDQVGKDAALAKHEQLRLQRIVLRHNSDLRGAYSRYSLLEHGRPGGHLPTMTSSSFLLFCKDTKIIPTLSQSLVQSILKRLFRQHKSTVASAMLQHRSECKDTEQSDSPGWRCPLNAGTLSSSHKQARVKLAGRSLSYREFVEAIVRISFVLINCHAPALSLSDALDLFITCFVCPIGQRSPRANLSNERNYAIKRPNGPWCAELLFQVSATLSSVTSQLETVAIRPILTILILLYNQEPLNCRNKCLSKALDIVLDVYEHRTRVWEGDNLSTAAVVLLCNAELNIAEVAEIFMRSKVMLSPSASELESSTAVPFKKQLLKATKQALAIEANADCPYFPGRAIHKVNVGVPTRQGVPTSGSI